MLGSRAHELVPESVAKGAVLAEWAPWAQDLRKLMAGHHSVVRLCIMAKKSSSWCAQPSPHPWEILLDQVQGEGGLASRTGPREATCT